MKKNVNFTNHKDTNNKKSSDSSIWSLDHDFMKDYFIDQIQEDELDRKLYISSLSNNSIM